MSLIFPCGSFAYFIADEGANRCSSCNECIAHGISCCGHNYFSNRSDHDHDDDYNGYDAISWRTHFEHRAKMRLH